MTGEAMLSSEIVNTAQTNAVTHATVTQAHMMVASPASRTEHVSYLKCSNKRKAGEHRFEIAISASAGV